MKHVNGNGRILRVHPLQILNNVWGVDVERLAFPPQREPNRVKLRIHRRTSARKATLRVEFVDNLRFGIHWTKIDGRINAFDASAFQIVFVVAIG